VGEQRCYARGAEGQRRHTLCTVPLTSACRSGSLHFLALPSMNRSLREVYRTPTCTQHSTPKYKHPAALTSNGSKIYAPTLQGRQTQNDWPHLTAHLSLAALLARARMKVGHALCPWQCS